MLVDNFLRIFCVLVTFTARLRVHFNGVNGLHVLVSNQVSDGCISGVFLIIVSDSNRVL